MPLFEFQCTDCHTIFEELVFSQDEIPNCPKCQSNKTQKLISRPCRNRKCGGADIPSMSEASSGSSSGGCAGCSGGSCATCGH